MDGFDRHDDLGRELRGAVPTGPSADRAPVVLDTLRPRMTRARHRRQVGAVLASSAAAVVIAIVAFTTMGAGSEATEIHVAGDPAPTTTTSTTSTSTTSTSTTTTVPAPTTTAPSATTAPPPTTVTETATTTVAAGSGGDDGATTTTKASRPTPTTTPTTAPPAAPAAYVVTSRGGRVSFVWTGNRVSAINVDATAGWTVRTSNDNSSEVEVRFRKNQEDVRVIGRMDKGTFSYSIDDNVDTGDSSGPPVSAPRRQG